MPGRGAVLHVLERVDAVDVRVQAGDHARARCPPAARTTTETVVAIRMAQRGFLRRTGRGGRGRPSGRAADRRAGAGRFGRCGRAGERGGVGKGDTSARVDGEDAFRGGGDAASRRAWGSV